MDDRWELYRETLKQQFLTEDKPLKDVKKFMIETYNFRAR